jgi:uncharacterized damage-inducible protein DinB
MLALLQDLVRHKVYANASLLKAIREHEAAARDEELRKLLHHILLANRFWFLLTIGAPFDAEAESRIPNSVDAVAAAFRETHTRELDWISQLQESELTRFLETPNLPGYKFSVAEAAMQVCMHSHGHRCQCATRLRSLGGLPPTMDFILWVKDHPAPDWSWLPAKREA